MRCVLDGIMLRQKTSKAPTADDDLGVTGKMLAQTFYVVHDLLECVGFGTGTLTVAPVVEGQDAQLVTELAVDGKI